jgi:thiamine biosynthesis lipoprotein
MLAIEPTRTAAWLRRARPLLGTLVEVGMAMDESTPPDSVEAAFAAIADVQACLSRFDPGSDVARFLALPPGACLDVRPHTAAVLAAAQALHDASDGIFDITLGSAPDGWRCEDGHWLKRHDGARIDLGGIGKGYAVDCAVRALLARGCTAGWVNAGGDVRAFGAVELPLRLRDEASGGVRPFALLQDGAFATSHFGAMSRLQAVSRVPGPAVHAHASVAAPLCLWADALTKVVAITGDTAHPLLARHGAQAWLH